jgi:cytosine deaminase
MLDLLIINANLPAGRTGMSIAVQNGRNTTVESSLNAVVHETINAGGFNR